MKLYGNKIKFIFSGKCVAPCENIKGMITRYESSIEAKFSHSQVLLYIKLLSDFFVSLCIISRGRNMLRKVYSTRIKHIV